MSLLVGKAVQRGGKKGSRGGGGSLSEQLLPSAGTEQPQWADKYWPETEAEAKVTESLYINFAPC